MLSPSKAPHSPLSLYTESPGNLFMVVAPSGAGKSTLVNALLAQDNDIRLSISSTTRAPRPNEEDGVHYNFISAEQFLERRKRGEFLESAEVHGNYYGTSRIWIEDQIREGRDVLLEIDWQGAQQVRKRFSNAVGIFVLPPSIEALEERLKKRGTDKPNVIARRLLAAGGEITHAPEADFIIINDEFQRALDQLQSVVTTVRLRFSSQYASHKTLFTDLYIHAPNENQ